MSALHQGHFQKKSGKREWWVLAGLALLAYALGCLGFFEYATGSKWADFIHGKTLDDLSVRFNSAYYALQMLVLNPPTLERPAPLSLQMGRWLAAGVFFYATLKVIFLILHRDIQSLRLWGRKNHVVICGLGQLGLPLALQARKSGEKPVAIEKDPDAESVAEALRNRIPVVIGDAADAATLRRARVHRASRVFAVCAEDETNIGVAAAVGNPNLRPLSTSKLECWLFIENPKLRSALQRHNVFPHHGPNCSVNVRGLDISAVRARGAFADLPLDHISLPQGSGKSPRLILAGFGQMGQSLAVQAARIAHFGSEEKLRILVVDEHAAERIKSFQDTFPNLDKVAVIEEIPGAIENPEVRDRVLDACKSAEKNGELLALAVCNEDDDARNLILALDLVREEPGGKAPVLVYLTTRCGFAQLMPAQGPRTTNPRLRPFGMIEDIWTFEALKDERQDDLARALHQVYLESREQSRTNDPQDAKRPGERPWEQLDETFREASRALADHLPIKLHAVGLKMLPMSECRPQAITALDTSQVELLSRMEHARWCAERWLAGWTHADEQNYDKKHHKDLVPWDDLPSPERKIDKDMMSGICTVLSRIGHGVAPLPGHETSG